MQVEITGEISRYVNSYKKEVSIHFETERQIRYRQTEAYYKSRIESQEKTIEEMETKIFELGDEEECKRIERVLPAHRGLLNKLLQEKNEALVNINRDPEISVSHSLKMLNLIFVK